ncbi:MAG: hypothetical protein GYB68_01850 [Chloroflexi bacterium]|nr:hypothetical protein [Chloroflexota bacterium]
MITPIPSNRQERWDWIESFLQEWRPRIPASPQQLDRQFASMDNVDRFSLPQSMTEWYRLVGRQLESVVYQNHFFPPDALKAMGDMLVVCVEHQGTVRWAIRLDDREAEDPPVFQDIKNTPAMNGGPRWKQVSYSFSEFVVQLVILETMAFAGYRANGVLERSGAEEIENTYSRLNLPDTYWPGNPTRFLVDGDRLLLQLDYGVPRSWLWIAAHDRETLFAAVEALDVDWQDITTADDASS